MRARVFEEVKDGRYRAVTKAASHGLAGDACGTTWS